MSEWQPIETAPKVPGDDVLLWFGGGARVGSWHDNWEYDVRRGPGPGWVIYGGYIIHPTHWAPINSPDIALKAQMGDKHEH